MDITDYIQMADGIVSDHFEKYVKTEQSVGVLLSGGIDSSLITSYVAKYYSNPHIFSMGTDSTKDKPFVQLLTHQLHKEFGWVYLSDEDILHALPEVKKILIATGAECSLMQMALATGYFLIFKRAHELGVCTIFTGQGPDILFAGYHKYKGLADEELTVQIKKDLILLETDKKRDGAMASHFGIRLFNPYLEEDFVKFSLTVPVEFKIQGSVEKVFMREWGRSLGLPGEIVSRPKKAFQYSTGLQKKINALYKRKDEAIFEKKR